MSYDLTFLVRETDEPPPPESLREYFRGRPGYTEQGDQFSYQNEDTGVYFSFDMHEGGGDGDAGDEEIEAVHDGLKATCLTFNINYFRPHCFGLEAEPELSAVVKRFSLLVDDPQSEGMARGAYSAEGFLRGWNAGNLFGHRAILSQAKGHEAVAPARFDSLPRAVLDRVWRWNYQRSRLQERLGEGIFVPGIRIVRHDDRPMTFIVWGDAIPEAVPEVDLLVLVRDELAPRGFFGKKRDTCLVPFSDLRAVQHAGRRAAEDPPYTLFDGEPPGPELTRFFTDRAPFKTKLDGLAFDDVLTREVLDEAKARG
jgi:hypothetical protein